MKLLLILVGGVLSGCVTKEEQKPILFTPAHFRLAESLCVKEKGLLWIQISKEGSDKFEVVCHDGAVKYLRVIL